MNFVPISRWSTRLLPHDVFAATVLDGKRIFISNEAGIFHMGEDNVLTPIGIDMPRKYYNVDRMHHDSTEAVYFSSRESNRLYRLPSGETKFHVVIPCLSEKPDGEDTVRGFAEMPGGRIFMGRYSRHGPARLLGSDDGETWGTAWEWDARHVHDVRLNPHSGWLYVVIGEGDPALTEESHSVWRSKDGGHNFQRIYRPEKTRPLFLPINFLQDRVILGTDHFRESNYVVAAVDDGGDLLGPFDILFRIPETPGSPKVQPFAFFLEWKQDTLFLGTRGSGAGALYASRNLKDWSIVQASSAAHGNAVTFVNCSRAVSGGPLIVSGRPGLKIQNSHSAEPLGIKFPSADTPEPSWVTLDSVGSSLRLRNA